MKPLLVFARAHLLLAGVAASVAAQGYELTWAFDTNIKVIAANAAADAHNSGTTCIHLEAPVHSSCEAAGGPTTRWLAIRNNNKVLLATALQAKATGAKVDVYYYVGDTAPSANHCPGYVYTRCSVETIVLK